MEHEKGTSPPLSATSTDSLPFFQKAKEPWYRSRLSLTGIVGREGLEAAAAAAARVAAWSRKGREGMYSSPNAGVSAFRTRTRKKNGAHIGVENGGTGVETGGAWSIHHLERLVSSPRVQTVDRKVIADSTGLVDPDKPGVAKSDIISKYSQYKQSMAATAGDRTTVAQYPCRKGRITTLDHPVVSRSFLCFSYTLVGACVAIDEGNARAWTAGACLRW